MFLLKDKRRVLVIGTGSSQIPFQLYDDPDLNIANMVCTDYSEVIVEKMKNQIGNRQNMLFKVEDCTKMNLKEENIDLIMEKGLLDAILCGEDREENSFKMLKNIDDAVQRGAVFLCISHAQPYTRLDFFNQFSWNVGIKKLLNEEEDEFFCYICTKQ